jgi:hypothetical protein
VRYGIYIYIYIYIYVVRRQRVKVLVKTNNNSAHQKIIFFLNPKSMVSHLHTLPKIYLKDLTPTRWIR